MGLSVSTPDDVDVLDLRGHMPWSSSPGSARQGGGGGGGGDAKPDHYRSEVSTIIFINMASSLR